MRTPEELKELKKKAEELQEELAALNIDQIRGIQTGDFSSISSELSEKYVSIQSELSSLTPKEFRMLKSEGEDKEQVTSLSPEELDDEMLKSVSGASIFFVPVVAIAAANVVTAVNAAANINVGVSVNATAIANAVANANVYTNANAT